MSRFRTLQKRYQKANTISLINNTLSVFLLNIWVSFLKPILNTLPFRAHHRLRLSKIRLNATKKMMLEYPDYSNDIISAECGFSCRTHLYRILKTKEGCSPTEWRAFHSTEAAQKGSNWAYPFFVKTPKKKQKFYRKTAKRVSHSYECDTFLVWMRHLNSEKPHLLSCWCTIFATWRK